MNEQHDRCQTCRFWSPQVSRDIAITGACVRHAPVLIRLTTSNEMYPVGQTPHTGSFYWCGDFERTPRED